MSSKSTRFECCVHLYDVKYEINLTENIHKNKVLFRDLYREIEKLDPKQDVSFETNTYEVYDSELNRFKRITSFADLIENSARVRVLLKPNVFKNFLLNSDKTLINANMGFRDRVCTSGSDQLIDRNSNTNQFVRNGRQLADSYIISSSYAKYDVKFNSIDSQLNGSQCWPQKVRVLATEPMSPVIGHSFNPLVSRPLSAPIDPLISCLDNYLVKQAISPPTGQSVGQPFVTTNPIQTPIYCPKIIDYSDNSNYNRSNSCETDLNTNYMQNMSQNTTQTMTSNLSNSFDQSPSVLISNPIVFNEKLLDQLREEGIEMKQNYNLVMFLCKVCDECFESSELALNHSQSDQHFSIRCGNYSDELDKSLVISTEQLSDIAVVLARKQELRKLDGRTKVQYLRHGIRIKNGIGFDAYVCLECKLSFRSLPYVRDHMKRFETIPAEDNPEIVYCSTTFGRRVESQSKKSGLESNKMSETKCLNKSDNSLKLENNKKSISDISDKELDKLIRKREKRSRHRLKNKEKTREKNYEKSLIREKERERKRELERHWIRERERAQERERERERKRKQSRDRSRDRTRDRNSGRNGDRTKDRERDRIENKEMSELTKEGIVLRIMLDKKQKYICRICDQEMPDKASAELHLRSDEHFGAKTGQTLRGIERLFVVDFDSDDKQLDYVLARKRQLRKVSFELKEECVYQGIRLKNGIGVDSYVCLTCNLSLDSIETVGGHLNWLDIHKNIRLFDITAHNPIDVCEQNYSIPALESLFRNEGLRYDLNSKDEKRSEKLFCVFCFENFANTSKALEHLNRPYHQKTKRAVVLKPIDAQFVSHSDRLDEFDVSYARMRSILHFSNERKIRYSEDGIRLRDGVGANAYVCLKCNVSIGADGCHSAAHTLIKHMNSRQHIDRLLSNK